MNAFLSLAARVEELTGPDREVDAEVATVLWGTSGKSYYNWQSLRPKGSPEKPTVDYWRGHATKLTASVDVLLAMIEHDLPGWRIENLCEWDHETLRSRGPWTCDLQRRGIDILTGGRGAKCAHAATPALALLSAALRAKAAQQQMEADRP